MTKTFRTFVEDVESDIRSANEYKYVLDVLKGRPEDDPNMLDKIRILNPAGNPIGYYSEFTKNLKGSVISEIVPDGSLFVVMMDMKPIASALVYKNALLVFINLERMDLDSGRASPILAHEINHAIVSLRSKGKVETPPPASKDFTAYSTHDNELNSMFAEIVSVLEKGNDAYLTGLARYIDKLGTPTSDGEFHELLYTAVMKAIPKQVRGGTDMHTVLASRPQREKKFKKRLFRYITHKGIDKQIKDIIKTL